LINIKNITKWDWRNYNNDYHYYCLGKKHKYDWMKKWGIEERRSPKKITPKAIFENSKECAKMFIRGLYDSDGCVQVSKAKGGTSICIVFTNTSLQLIKELQFLLTHFGIVSFINKDKTKKKEKHYTRYNLLITGDDCVKFKDKINFGLSYKVENLKKGIDEKIKNNSYRNVPFAQELMLDICKKIKMPKNSKNYGLCRSKIKCKTNITLKFLKSFLERSKPAATPTTAAFVLPLAGVNPTAPFTNSSLSASVSYRLSRLTKAIIIPP
jgi:hypothetical protein